MDGNGCGICRLSSERGLIPGDLSLWSGHRRAPLVGCLHPRGSTSKLACNGKKSRHRHNANKSIE